MRTWAVTADPIRCRGLPYPVNGGRGPRIRDDRGGRDVGLPGSRPPNPAAEHEAARGLRKRPNRCCWSGWEPACGVLMFVWGFLPWYGLAATDVNGYGFGSPAPVVIGLSLLASGVAAARTLDQKSASPLVPLAAAAVAVLVSFGLIVDRGDNVSLNVGLILAVVTTLLQAAAFALAWLHEIGRLGVRAQSDRWSGNTPYGYGRRRLATVPARRRTRRRRPTSVSPDTPSRGTVPLPVTARPR